MQPPATFTTSRLLLRQPEISDAEAVFSSYAQDREVTRYLIWTPHPDVETTRAFLRYCRDAWQRGDEFAYVITERDTNQLLGMLSLRISNFKASLGYVLARSAWGRGIMTEAATAVTEWALAQPSIYRVWAVCDVDNPASARVMEKIGMQPEGIMRRGMLHPNVSNEPRDCLVYAKVK